MTFTPPTPATRRTRNMLPLNLVRWLLLVPLVLAILIFCGWAALQGLSAMNVGEVVQIIIYP